jgi:chemotaxis protein MotB
MFTHTTVRRVLPLVVLVLASACVKKGTYESALDELARSEAEREAFGEEIDRLEQRIQQLDEEMAAEMQRRDVVERDLREDSLDLERRIRQLRDQFDGARAEVDRLETVLSHRGAEYQSLLRRLESIQALEQEVRERNRIYEDVIARFRSLMDGGQLSVSILRGRLVIQLPQDVLFASGSATLGQEGRAVVGQVGDVLADFEDRRFQVEGHTDNVPIATERFPSNWELSSARALAVVRLLAQQGVAPENLSGAAFGEFQPVASNDDRASRARNRRIEIVMLPNLDVIAEETETSR